MKNIINDPNNIYTMINDQVSSLILDEKIKLDKEAETIGRQLGESQLPRIMGDKLATYILPIKSGYRALANHVAKLMASGEEQKENEMDETFIHSQIATEEQKLAESLHKVKSYIVQREKIVQEYNWKFYNGILVLLGIIAFIQVIIDGSSLQALNFSLLTSYFFSAGLAVSTVTISHKIKSILDLVNTRNKKILLLAGILLFFGLVFLALASFRVTMLNTEASFAGATTQILSFVLLNEAILIGALTLAYFALPSKIDVQKKLKHDELTVLIQEQEQVAQALQKGIEDLKIGLQTRIVLRQKNKKLAEDTQVYIASLYENTVGKFIQSNCVSRADGTPDIFSEEIPPLFNEQQKK